MENQKLWKTILGELELTLPRPSYQAFFPKTKIKEVQNNQIIISCPKKGIQEVIEQKYKNLIKNLIENKTGKTYEIKYIVEQEKTSEIKAPLFDNIIKQEEVPQNKTPQQAHLKGTGLLKEYTFENFVVGPNNRLAYTVAKTIAEKPGLAYNPFLIYSGVGLGKTHLLQAIGNEILKNDPSKKVLYCTGQEFINELMDQLQERRSGKQGTLRNFKNKFTNSDVWLIDDVQVIAGRDTTQEEFYFAFNHLYLNKKQIVLTSDKHPSEIAKLEERISSRFNMGMIADIQMPDIDVRTAILRLKRDSLGLDVPNETIDYIAKNLNKNIRELEGALIQVATYAQAYQEVATVKIAKQVLENSIVEKEEKNVKPQKVLREVAKFYNLDIRDIKGKTRTKEIVKPRQIAMFLLKEINQLPLMQIGALLGGRDHTTIMYGTEKVKKEVENGNFRLKKELSIIKENILKK